MKQMYWNFLLFTLILICSVMYKSYLDHDEVRFLSFEELVKVKK